MKEINKDFYNDLPSMVCEQLDRQFIPKFQNEPWFDKAWEEYRQHVKTSSMDDVKIPYSIFKKYIQPLTPLS
jgi:hypothetical protein